jgi:insertion element IS1 protein InsB
LCNPRNSVAVSGTLLTIERAQFSPLFSPRTPMLRGEQLQQLLAPFSIRQFYTDSWGAYLRLLDSSEHIVGKTNTQKIERKHLTLRTRIKRLARKTICFSKSIWLHDVVIGLFINRYEFGRDV